MVILTTRAAASAHLLAATGTPVQGRTAPAAGFGTSVPAGIALDRNPIPHGTPMS